MVKSLTAITNQQEKNKQLCGYDANFVRFIVQLFVAWTEGDSVFKTEMLKVENSPIEVDESGDCVTVLLVMIRGNQWCYWKTPITLTTVIYWPSNVSLEIGGDDNYYKISDDASDNDNNNDHNDHNDKSH